MSTFILKNKSLNFTPVSNIFIEKYMPNARGEFIKVYLLMLKYNNSGEMGASSSILASTLNLLESDILNALNYWNDEGVIKLIPVDKMGNFNVEFVDLVEDSNKAINSREMEEMMHAVRDLYDYVIVDEASQVDLATGVLALSCAKKAVIVGDLKQLPNVVNGIQKKITDEIFDQYDLDDAYRYSEHSLLSSITTLFPDVAHVLLREHYRCHPEIIGFCNQRFYNNELIILTNPKSDRQPMMVYRTVPGNHARGHLNQRQIDVITDEVFPKQNLTPSDASVGIVTPYRRQAEALQKMFDGTTVKADTADKFQGQERSVMIFSTVDNEIGEFASDPNRLNVAVSRAIDQFIVVTDGNNNDSISPIHDLIGYIQYHNHEVINSEIHSVFDYLYKSYANARELILKKYGRISEVESENLVCVDAG